MSDTAPSDEQAHDGQPDDSLSTRTQQPCAGGLVFDARHRLLLVRRGRAPAAGTWSIPGGRCETGEAPPQACVRELLEETGLVVQIVRWVGRVRRDSEDVPRPGAGVEYVIDDYLCRVVGGTLAAGDDAADARWVSRAGLVDLEPGLAPGVLAALTAWRMLPG